MNHLQVNQTKIFQIFRRGGVKLNFLETQEQLSPDDCVNKFVGDVEVLYSAKQRDDGADYDNEMHALMQKLYDRFANLLDTANTEHDAIQEMLNVFCAIEDKLITQPGKENTRVLRKDGAGAMQFFISGASRYFAVHAQDDKKSKKIKGALSVATQLNLNSIDAKLQEKQSKVFNKNTMTVAKTLERELMIGGAAGGVIAVSGGTALIPTLIVCGVVALYEGIKAGVKCWQRKSKLKKKYLKPYNDIRNKLNALDKTLGTPEKIQQQNLGDENKESIYPAIENAQNESLNQNLLGGNNFAEVGQEK